MSKTSEEPIKMAIQSWDLSDPQNTEAYLDWLKMISDIAIINKTEEPWYTVELPDVISVEGLYRLKYIQDIIRMYPEQFFWTVRQLSVINDKLCYTSMFVFKQILIPVLKLLEEHVTSTDSFNVLAYSDVSAVHELDITEYFNKLIGYDQ